MNTPSARTKGSTPSIRKQAFCADPYRWTTTRRPVVRLLYVGIALVLSNLWVWLHSTILSMPSRGGRMIMLERLRWETLLFWLLHVAEEKFGVNDATYTERDVEYELSL